MRTDYGTLVPLSFLLQKTMKTDTIINGRGTARLP